MRNLDSRFRNNAVLLLVAAVVFLLVWRIGYWTPLQSDDYFFLRRGFSFDATVGTYLTWSGRVIADFFGSLILSTRNQLFVSGFNALMLVAFIALVAIIPTMRSPAKISISPIVAGFLFCLYWVANPSLGQTTLWVIGSANYVWTNVVQLAFLALFIAEIHRNVPKLSRQIPLVILAFLAGVTNENTAVTTSALVGFLTIREYYSGRPNKWLVASALAVVAGTLVLLLAPGNFARLTFAPQEWGQMSLIAKLKIHFLERMVWMFSLYWQALAVFLIVVVCLPRKSETRFYGFVFAAASVVAGSALVVLPGIAHRTVNGGLMYILIAISFVSYELLQQPTWRKYVPKALGAVGIVYFIFSYIPIYKSYRDLSLQAAYRDNVVTSAIADGAKKIEIPSFYRGHLLKPHDGPDWHFAGEYMAAHFGTDAEITQFEVTRTYGPDNPPVRRP